MRRGPGTAGAALALLLGVLWGLPAPAGANTNYFVDVTTSMPVVNNISRDVDIGDIDGDGDVDAIIAVSGRNRLLVNDGAGLFGDASHFALPADAAQSQDAKFGDFDLDGDLDIFVANRPGQNVIYVNDGTGVFTLAPAGVLPVIDDSSIEGEFCDLDGDGDLDLVVANFGPNEAFENLGGTYVARAWLPAVNQDSTDITCGDVDGDGDLDIAVANLQKSGSGGAQNLLYRNDLSVTGKFANVTAASFPVVIDRSADINFCDVNMDGHPDIATANLGNGNLGGKNALWFNDGTGGFTNQSGRLPNVADVTKDVECADVDGDGDMDLLDVNESGTSLLMINVGSNADPQFALAGNGNTAFLPADSSPFRGARFFDGNQDGRPDIMIVGGYSLSAQDRIYLNSQTQPGRFINATQKGRIPVVNDLTQDAEFADFNNDGRGDIIVGNRGQQNRLYLNNALSLVGYSDITAAALPVASDQTISVTTADVDGDGDRDIYVSNFGVNLLLINRFIPNGVVAFSIRSGPWQAADQTAHAAFGDVDGDGDLDLAIANLFRTGTHSAQNRLYLNDGAGNFTDATGGRIPLRSDRTAEVEFFDIRGDGTADDIVFGNLGPLNAPNDNNPGGQNYVLINDGTGHFTDETAARWPVMADTTKGIRGGDANGDGLLDLVVVNENTLTLLMINQGGGVFANESATRLPVLNFPFRECQMDDIDLDGDDDLVFVGGYDVATQNRVLVNDGTGHFTDETAIRIPPDHDKTRDGAYQDIDGDGDLDMFVSNAGQNKLYINQTFVPDFDQDGYTIPAGDCDDHDPNTYPGAPEILDGKDNNCNGLIDEGLGPPGDDRDGDGVPDAVDNCPDVPNPPAVPGGPQADADGDGVGDACDSCAGDAVNDPDGDGVCASVDNCPLAANPGQEDADGDGMGDVCDICPLDLNNDLDADGLCGDADNCPNIANEDQLDTDGDGVGDVCDTCPLDNPDDTDGDGVCDSADACPGANDFLDADTDAVPDACDYCPADGDNDSDGDLLCEASAFVAPPMDGGDDNCPTVFNPLQEDTDEDGVGNVCEPLLDSDGDGTPDLLDNCPDVAAHQYDTDSDGVGDACDNCIADPNPFQEDADHDGFGDACDDDPVALADLPAGAPGGKCKRCSDPPPPPADADADGVADTADNCVNAPNAGQQDADLDGVGDACDLCPQDDQNDADHDGACGDVDNCPAVANVQSENLDADGYDPTDPTTGGDACDDDADGDTFVAKGAGGDDCDDLDAGTYPGAPGGWPADCDAAPPYVAAFSLAGEAAPVWRDPDGATTNTIVSQALWEWLPTETGPTITVRAQVLDASRSVVTGDLTLPLQVTVPAGGVTAYVGTYANDERGIAGPDLDVVPGPAGTSVDTAITPHDFGGSVLLDFSAEVLGSPFAGQVRIPYDRDGDELPEVWETQYGDLSHDQDDDRAPVANGHDGDGQSAFREYRGYVWGPALTLYPVGSHPAYSTDTYLPEGPVSHFRSSPLRRDLFVEYENYGAAVAGPVGYPIPVSAAPLDPGDKPPFALGGAYAEQDIDVRVRDVAIPAGKLGIDVAHVKHDELGHYGNPVALDDATLLLLGYKLFPDVDTPIIKPIGTPPHEWGFATRGASNYGTSTAYGTGTRTYHRALVHYFDDRPYFDNGLQSSPGAPGAPGGAVDGVLNAAALGEDVNDDGFLTSGEDDGDGLVAGDYRDATWETAAEASPLSLAYQHALSGHDIDADGLVELPFAQSPGAVPAGTEHSFAQVTKHTITHEIGHAVGLVHLTYDDGIMYQWAINWTRDGHFSNAAAAGIMIH